LHLDVDPRPNVGPEGKRTVFCTRCGHPNRDDARFCANCGASLQDDSTVTLTPLEPEEDENVEFPFPEDELEAGQALLQVKRGPNAGSTFLLDADATSVGRSTDSDVFLDDITVSRKHATFERRPRAEWFVRDAGSLNGTYVNGEQVDETKLANGDQVQIGRFKLTFFQAEE
jgi:pSer/pThr/pTyr-binding forkhead associated (FHA) protein